MSQDCAVSSVQNRIADAERRLQELKADFSQKTAPLGMSVRSLEQICTYALATKYSNKLLDLVFQAQRYMGRLQQEFLGDYQDEASLRDRRAYAVEILLIVERLLDIMREP